MIREIYMTNFNKSQNSKKSDETSSRKESLSEMRKLDPDLVEVFLQIRPKVDTPKSLDEKIHKMCMDHENNKHEKLDWIKWLSSIFLQRPKFLNSLGMYWNPFLVQNLRTLMYSFAGLFLIVLATIAYYQYTKPYPKISNIISNQQIPKSTPIVTPSPIETISPNITKSPENNRNGLGKSDSSENDQQILQAKKKKTRKLKLLDGEQIALLRAKQIDLLSVETIYVSEKISIELREELNSLLKTIDRFKIVKDSEIISTQPDATFQFSSLDSQLIVLRKKALNVEIWQKSIDTTLTPKDQASTVVLSLMESIKEAEEKTKRTMR
ncbi:MAG: hypothetical protein WAQ98_22780 [Blastocatellia bacterium]